jgi:hypothetical protein
MMSANLARGLTADGSGRVHLKGDTGAGSAIKQNAIVGSAAKGAIVDLIASLTSSKRKTLIECQVWVLSAVKRIPFVTIAAFRTSTIAGQSCS